MQAGTTRQDEATDRLWTRLEVRSWTTTGRTRLTLLGAVDAAALHALRAAIATARDEGQHVILDLDHITSVRRSALGGLLELIARVSCQRTSTAGG